MVPGQDRTVEKCIVRFGATILSLFVGCSSNLDVTLSGEWNLALVERKTIEAVKIGQGDPHGC